VRHSGWTLTNWSSNTAVIAGVAPKKKHSLLPLLTVLFIFSYGLMTMLIVEQGATIQSQSNMIKILLPESRELWSIRGRAITQNQAAKAHAQGQAPSKQGQEAAAQPVPQAHSQAGQSAKPHVQLPPIPASELDPRRAVRTI